MFLTHICRKSFGPETDRAFYFNFHLNIVGEIGPKNVRIPMNLCQMLNIQQRQTNIKTSDSGFAPMLEIAHLYLILGMSTVFLHTFKSALLCAHFRSTHFYFSAQV